MKNEVIELTKKQKLILFLLRLTQKILRQFTFFSFLAQAKRIIDIFQKYISLKKPESSLRIPELIEQISKSEQKPLVFVKNCLVQGVIKQFKNQGPLSLLSKNPKPKLLSVMNFKTQVYLYNYFLIRKLKKPSLLFKDYYNELQKLSLKRFAKIFLLGDKLDGNIENAVICVPDSQIFCQSTYTHQINTLSQPTYRQKVSQLIYSLSFFIGRKRKEFFTPPVSLGTLSMEYGVKFDTPIEILGDFIYNPQTKTLRCHKPLLIGNREEFAVRYRNTIILSLIILVASYFIMAFIYKQAKQILNRFQIKLAQKFINDNLINSQAKLPSMIYTEPTDNLDCVLCQHRLRQIIQLPCCHFQYCQSCFETENPKMCQFCNRQIDSSIKLFDS